MTKKSDRRVYHVTPDQNKGWKVKREGAARASDCFENKGDAIQRGKELAKSASEGQIIIHRRDGRIQTEHTYKNDPFPPKG
ncbi:conserved hypothetical protein [uncultured Desulfobacterium sp.]|uniref:DUF2188 domain-containing protein n=1 Tax=uncultured Desulfobacterium sp. TaxID=201089 RepID=A0A445MR96_9BACT|nr:conserved hypothetical protein [uncultured Desulfobacterium sp.]